MKTVRQLLQNDPQVSGYKLNTTRKESFELFFVKGKLETVRCTDTCDREVTVYVSHEEFLGDAQFVIYPSTTEQQLRELIDEAVDKARLIQNPPYTLPAGETGTYQVESNFDRLPAGALAEEISRAVFGANGDPCCSLNSVEIFVNRYTETVENSRGLNKQQVRYDAMVEAIPTYNGDTASVELYEQLNFSSLDVQELSGEIARSLQEVKARYEAATPAQPLSGKVILRKNELADLYWRIASNLSYGSVYSHSSLFQKGSAIQSEPVGDTIGIRMTGAVPGCTRSACFDSDGMTLREIRIVDKGVAVNYFGDNRYGQYLKEEPTGNLRCMLADPGTAPAEAFREGAYLEVLSMSGLQVDFFSDYIGGEVRLAYFCDGEKRIPVTGISISGSLKEVLNHIRFSAVTATQGGYTGPEQAILDCMKIY